MRKENAFQVQFSETSYNKPQTNHKKDSNPGRDNLLDRSGLCVTKAKVFEKELFFYRTEAKGKVSLKLLKCSLLIFNKEGF